MGIAVANAVINEGKGCLPEADTLDILVPHGDDIVGMVGHFGPLVPKLKERVAELRIFEKAAGKGAGVYPEEEETPAPSAPRHPSRLEPAGFTPLLPESIGAPRRYSLAALAGAALAVSLLPESALLGPRPLPVPVAPPRSGEGAA